MNLGKGELYICRRGKMQANRGRGKRKRVMIYKTTERGGRGKGGSKLGERGRDGEGDGVHLWGGEW